MTKEETQGGKENTEITQDQIDQIVGKLKQGLDPEGKNPGISQFVDSTSQYISDAYAKMQSTSNKEDTAKEIADDITGKLENWLKSRSGNSSNETSSTSNEEKQESSSASSASTASSTSNDEEKQE
ncbi:hypothetical protein JA1_001333 [Spathaspora sp. JA1]|nr:hypothetical protein JA1_001333 [Spathaspora sp. JA1]